MSNSSFEQRNVLLIDADEAFGQVLQPLLGHGYLLLQEPSPTAAIAAFDSETLDAVVLNLDAPNHEENSRLLLQAATNRDLPLPVIAYSWEAGGQKVLDAFKEGAFDTLTQPLDVQQLRFALDRACRRVTLIRELVQARRLLGLGRVEGLLGNSQAMERVSEMTRKVAEVFTTVLITGGSGTGKGAVAQAIHRLSPRSAKPFVAFSVCSFPDSLIEDELFGHEKGAFTGAGQARRGRFEEANGGTIFIDEIGDLALPLQAKLLRALQERTVERLGSNVPRPLDTRVICATNRNLEKMVEDGTFRQDLYFRISVVKIQMPSLRERKEDIPLLAEYFLRSFAKTHGKAARMFTPGFLSALSRHSWPGNVRELQNVIERSVVLANGNEYLGVADLPEELRELTVANDDMRAGSFHEAVQGFKKELVRSALRMHSGNRLKAAVELGISRCYLHRLLNQFNLAEEESAQEALNIALLEEFNEPQAQHKRLTARLA
ncbi:MAG: sigma-54-dependent Fis family transcriptional regulator [Acidobacteriaceae bacterium]|nr:sigma-54-dependent Fis family transcriptional regulator [Acidobacteriaceae bacterium]